jgi:copper chaperone CopZ
MSRRFLLALVVVALLAGCREAPPAVAVLSSPVSSTATGPRWIVVKAEGLGCSSCAAQVQGELEKVAGLSQIETFAPAPYCRFYVDDGDVDVPPLLNELPGAKSTLAGWRFIRGG